MNMENQTKNIGAPLKENDPCDTWMKFIINPSQTQHCDDDDDYDADEDDD